MILDRVRNKLRIRSDLARCVLCEFCCTFIFMPDMIRNVVCLATVVKYIGFCVNANAVLTRKPASEYFTIHFGWGISLFFAVQMGFRISGSLINPAISLFMFSFGHIGFAKFLCYVIVQFFGTFCAAAVAFLTYYDGINEFDGGIRQVYGPNATAGIFGTYPREYLSVGGAIWDQIACSAALGIMVSLVTDRRNKIPLFLQPFYIGFMMLITGISLANAGNAMNPARDFSPRLFTWIVGYGSEVWSYNNYCWFWIPLVFPFIGAGLGAWLYHLLIGIHIWNKEDEEKTPILPISIKPPLFVPN
ncbi:hypothetical protein QR680_004676 [Steinernema hermaphroditum]|uniref:Aquaporin-3 n=1 Tax=Steinernema hermaphroditum TaxID=289476 RepID=A0AA39LTK5_9BILA|nr:hypothetical protein QR680_004676 [Steinernema hermaphroditum]